MSEKNSISTLNLWETEVPSTLICPTYERLARAFSRLQNIRLVRNHRQDPNFGKPAEARIIWRELLELELQSLDEQVDQMSAAVETAKRAASVPVSKEGAA